MNNDPFCEYYQEHLSGVYDCVDRIVLLAYNPLLQSPGGFRHWWRILFGDDTKLDTTHVMRFAGHFSRRIRAYAKSKGIAFQQCGNDERKHEIAQTHIPDDPHFEGIFCILSARAPAPVYEVQRCGNSINLKKKQSYVSQYSFHIMDSDWGHITIKLSPHPPFNAMIMLNGHEYVERAMRKKGIIFTKEDNCFTRITDAAGLATVADSMISSDRDVGRLTSLCERWIYSACLCFALDTTEQERTRFKYSYSVYQAEYSRNLLFQRPSMVDTVFQKFIDRNRTTLDIGTIKTIIGRKHRPHYKQRYNRTPRMEVVIEKPTYDLTIFKLHYDKVTVKMYSKGEHVLRVETIAHNTKALHPRRGIVHFEEIIVKLRDILQRFMERIHASDVSFISASALERWHLPAIQGQTRIAGIDLNNQRNMAVMESLIKLSVKPATFTTFALAQQVRLITGCTEHAYTTRHASYDLKKFRAKQIVVPCGRRRYIVTPQGLKSMVAYHTIRDKVLFPVLRQIEFYRRKSYNTKQSTSIEKCFHQLQASMKQLLFEFGIAA